MKLKERLLKKYPDNKDKDFDKVNEELKEWDNTEGEKQDERMNIWKSIQLS